MTRSMLRLGLALGLAIAGTACGRGKGGKAAPDAGALAPEPGPGNVPAAAQPPATPTEPAPAASPERPPEPPPHVALRPTFHTAEGTHAAGTAYLVKWDDGRHILLTAQHLFGQMGGMSRDIGGAEMPRIFKSLEAKSADDATIQVEADRLVVLPDATTFTQTVVNRDLAAFLVADPGKAAVLALATELPAKGAPVYLVAELADQRPGRLWPARVEAAAPDIIIYTFDDPELDLRATSGAPLIDAHGRVVATNLGGGKSDGRLVCFGNPVVSMRGMLAGALEATK
jgi:hypothetical protein